MKKVVLILIMVSVGLFGNTNAKIDSLLERAQNCRNTNIDSVGINLQMAYNIAIQTNDYENKIKVIYELINYAGIKVNFDLGNKYFKEGIALSKEQNDIKSQADLLLSMGVLYEKSGSYDQSISVLVNASKIFDSLGLKKEMVNAYRFLSHDFALKHNFDKEYEYALKALKTASTLKDDNLLAQANAYVASALSDLNKLDSAVPYFNKSIKLYEELNDINNLSITYSNMGLLYQKDERYKEAERMFVKAYKFAKQIHYFTQEVYIEMELGCLYTSMKQYDKAEHFILLALEREKEAKYSNLTKDLLMTAYIFYKETGKCDRSLDFLEKYSILTDSLNQINSDQRVVDTETKFRTKEKEKEIEVLNLESNLQQSQLKRRNIAIASSGVVIIVVLILLFTIFKSKKRQIKTNSLLKEKNREITDSIHYAQKIQATILPRNVDDQNKFILFQPKDIVSGDFYWYKKDADDMYIAAADCTGHGVPGALMSIINNELLNNSLINHSLPCKMLSYVNSALLNRMAEFQRQDGMDIGLVKYNAKEKLISYAGAKRPLYLVRNGILTEYKGTKYSIGGDTPGNAEFDNTVIEVHPGDCFYITTDGFGDQFGGADDKKYGTKKLKDFLVTLSSMATGEQRETLRNEIRFWKGNTEQTDDICVIGIKI